MLWAAIALAGFHFSVFAQDKGKVEFGFHFGGSQSTMSDGYYSEDPSYSFNTGASAEYYFSEAWGLKVRAIYDRKGFDEAVFKDGLVADVNLDYLSIPLTAVWHFGNDNAWYLHFGFYYAALLKSEETSFGSSMSDTFKSSDFGVAYGVGYKLKLNDRLKLFFEVDAQGGFTDIVKDYEYDPTNSRVALNVGLNFLMN